MQQRIAYETELANRLKISYDKLNAEHQDLEQQLYQVKTLIKAEYAKLHASN